ncbi:MAG: hypothetical protein CM15mP13_0840 [Pseudomonadota bacterium]|nr:MAG: hypothetical protein CM15mP13_0840 [Pseudomonadota bacterium]
MRTVVVSGGFDPVHVGHLQLFEEAKKLGDYLIVIVNSDKFLQDKKKLCFYAFERKKTNNFGF